MSLYDDMIELRRVKRMDFLNYAIDIVAERIEVSISENPYNDIIKILYDKNIINEISIELINHFTEEGFYITYFGEPKEKITNKSEYLGLLINLGKQAGCHN